MNLIEDVQQRTAKFDLLAHPFYRAWSAGQLTAADRRAYAADYYHHVAAFPTYLSALHSRLPDGEMRRAVLRNLCEEEIEGVPHSELWLDFAEGMGANREQVRASRPSQALAGLIGEFRSIMRSEDPAAAFGALYAYESQVPRIAREKAAGLKSFYGADPKTCRYFRLHETADVEHARVWQEQMERAAAANPACAVQVAETAERAARALWTALDGMEELRISLSS